MKESDLQAALGGVPFQRVKDQFGLQPEYNYNSNRQRYKKEQEIVKDLSRPSNADITLLPGLFLSVNAKAVYLFFKIEFDDDYSYEEYNKTFVIDLSDQFTNLDTVFLKQFATVMAGYLDLMVTTKLNYTDFIAKYFVPTLVKPSDANKASNTGTTTLAEFLDQLLGGLGFSSDTTTGSDPYENLYNIVSILLKTITDDEKQDEWMMEENEGRAETYDMSKYLGDPNYTFAPNSFNDNFVRYFHNHKAETNLSNLFALREAVNASDPDLVMSSVFTHSPRALKNISSDSDVRDIVIQGEKARAGIIVSNNSAMEEKVMNAMVRQHPNAKSLAQTIVTLQLDSDSQGVDAKTFEELANSDFRRLLRKFGTYMGVKAVVNFLR